MEQGGWFEQRYPNLLEDARLRFVNTINNWVENNWGESQFNEDSPRIAVHGRNKYESKKNENVIWTNSMMRDNRFEGCGDKPQTFWEADQLVGSFAIDFETPVPITYTQKNVQGKPVDSFEWTAFMYIEDTLGLQPQDPKAWLVGRYAPSRTVKRARWEIHGEGVKVFQQPVRTHQVIPGDTLSGLARKYYGDASLWPIIYKINQENIGINPSMLRVGVVLEIPELNQLSPGFKESAMGSAPPATPAPNTIRIAPLR